MGGLAILVVLAALLESAGATAASHELYDNVVPADTADCLEKIAALPLATYELKFDSVKGRRHLGPFGPDLEKVIPGSVEVHGKSTYPSPIKGEPPIVLENQAVVDKSVIFMNNVAAVQELAERNEAMRAQLEEQLAFDARMHVAVDEMGTKLAEEADSQLVERKRIVEAEAEEARLAAKLKVVKAEEAQKTLDLEAQQKQEALEQQLEISRRKLAAESESKRAEAEEALRIQMDVERVQAEVEAKLAAEHQNEDVMLRKIRAQGDEDRKRTQEAINTILAHLASAAVGLLSDPRRVLVLSSWLLGLLAGYLFLKEGTLLLRQLVETYLGKPGLVRETSRLGTFGSTVHSLRRFAKSIERFYRSMAGVTPTSPGECWSAGRPTSGRAEAVRAFQDVVLTPDLKEQAACSGMDCAVMSGGDVGPLGKDAVTELHGLFRWAAKSPRGLLLFIDEAEAFLGKRSSPGMSEDTRNALNALLHNTGSASRRLMMVLATNRAEDLDEAVLDRMDDSLLFPIPDNKSRAQLLVQYFNKYCAPGGDNAATSKRRGVANMLPGWWQGSSAKGLVIGAGVDERLIRELSEEVQGFSGREVMRMNLAR
eukprot:g6660.t1